jgi:hypothetical protein
MRRLTTRQLINHFGNFPNVRVETPEGFRHLDSIANYRTGDVMVTTVDPGGLSGESFVIPATDIDIVMWVIS